MRARGERGTVPVMSAADAIALAVAVALFFYLVYALLRGERL
jgi:K+-transporting ATPase KdpF subunit